ncbi:DUF1684 domain-containing protein [Chondrinema litorale]|uniref:DUF1684 domain-containing protein n=1 Tax=Chondrinema litorale TaxID=2994555 RepID=UPI002542816E|nr:DUF1684 domain-containing protein [Chondrinema litorale]UZR99384.1 DUF1684 domain-containing protein [Chondrinema litorale]
MKKILCNVLILISFTGICLAQDYKKEIKEFQKELNEEYKNPDESPLSTKDRKKFKGHDFFPIDEKYRVEAKFVKTANAMPFKMKTSANVFQNYDIYGVVSFEIDGEEFKLNIYQSHSLRETEEYKDYLFLPFTDLTNGTETYRGGRYIDLSIPSDNTIVIDFNKAYNPYCAYSTGYSCPIPPKENNLDIKVEAGIKNNHL